MTNQFCAAGKAKIKVYFREPPGSQGRSDNEPVFPPHACFPAPQKKEAARTAPADKVSDTASSKRYRQETKYR